MSAVTAIYVMSLVCYHNKLVMHAHTVDNHWPDNENAQFEYLLVVTDYGISIKQQPGYIYQVLLVL